MEKVMVTSDAWRTLTPIFDTSLSCGQLIAQGEIFAIVNSVITATQLDPPHWHDTYEIGCVLQGTGIMVMGERVYPYVPGQVYVINDLIPHRTYSDEEETLLFVVHFHPALLESSWLGQKWHAVQTPFLLFYMGRALQNGYTFHSSSNDSYLSYSSCLLCTRVHISTGYFIVLLCTRVHELITSIYRSSSERKQVDSLRQQEISIEDIARAAGVSHSTVSRALHGSTLISVDVRERIQQLAQQMGYTPNAVARSLQMRRTHTIGLVITSIADPFFGDVVKGVEEVARVADFSVFLSASHNDSRQETAIIDSFHQRRVDGILISSSRISSNYKERLGRTRVPIVLINSQAESYNPLLHWVAVDDREGTQLAVEHLSQLGHSAIGYLGTESRPRSNRDRFAGYRDALMALRIAGRDDWVVIAPETDALPEEDVRSGQTLLPRLLAAGVTAVLCYNDMLAIGALLACRERGIAVPEELSIMGFDDITMADYVFPPLTTIHQPKVGLGKAAMEMLLHLLDERPVENHTLAPTLKLRASTAPRS